MSTTSSSSLASRALGSTGINVSILGFGAEAIGRKGRSFEDADRTLNAVLDMGVNLIDTASAYGRSEEFIGRAIADRKNEFTVVTKCGWVGDWEPAWLPQQLASTIDSSLRALQTDCLDVLLLHSCGIEELQKGDVVSAIQNAKAKGKARFIGYSGDNEALQFAINLGIFDVVETSFNILDQANASAIAQANQRHMGILIKRPIANAVPGRSEKPRSDYAAQYWPRWQSIGLSSSDINGLPWLDVAVRFTAFWSGVSSVLVGSSHAEHMLDNVTFQHSGIRSLEFT